MELGGGGGGGRGSSSQASGRVSDRGSGSVPCITSFSLISTSNEMDGLLDWYALTHTFPPFFPLLCISTLVESVSYFCKFLSTLHLMSSGISVALESLYF